MTGDVQGGFSVSYQSSDQSAISGLDYQGVSGELQFTGFDGEIQEITVSITDDILIEPTESYTLSLSNLSTSLITIIDGEGLGTIIDNDTSILDDGASTDEDTSVVLDVLANDTASPNATIELVETTPPNNGLVVVNGELLTYTPNNDFNGVDSFEYTVLITNADGTVITETAIVTITVNPIRDVNDDYDETVAQNAIDIDVLANDTFSATTTLAVTEVSTPLYGNAIINDDNTVTYTANESFYGDDAFEYTVTVTNADGTTTQEIAMVIITVYAIPFAIDDEVVTEANIPIEIAVLDNDYDEDGSIDISSVQVVDEPLNGDVIVNNDGTITYTPNEDFIGEDTFVYQVCDNDGLCDTATVTIIVTGVLGAELIIPEGFSPNGDGNHDVFYIRGLVNLYPNFKLQIFNRWGNIVYDYTHNGNTLSEPLWWDGYSSGRMTVNKGKQVPVGTYFYVLYFNKDNTKPRSGYVYLNR